MPMTIDKSKLITKYTDLIDFAYKKASVITDLESNNVMFDGSKYVKIMKVTAPDAIDYVRADGFKEQDAGVDWETWELTQDKQIAFSVDTMDNNELGDKYFSTVAGETVRTKVIPMRDTYVFNKIANTSGIGGTTETLTADNIMSAIATAQTTLGDAEVAETNLILYVNYSTYALLKQKALNRFGTATEGNVNTNIETFDGIKIVRVPASRLGNGINFILVDRLAVVSTLKWAVMKIFTPDENQTADAWKFQLRYYYDAFVYDNKKAGIYVSKTAE